MTQNKIIQHTKNWLTDIIIKYSICPFAKKTYDENHIHYEVIETSNVAEQLEQLILQCEAMDKDAKRETSLLIFPKGLNDFEIYLDVLGIATELMDKQGYEGIYQLASFHPHYRFEGSKIDDASNYTNRSPYPMLHILREKSIENVLKMFDKPENIPIRNIELTNHMGLKTMKNLLSDCYK